MNARDHDSTIEDLTFLAEHGVGLEQAATRTGFNNTKALDKWLRRHDQVPLLNRLSNQERRAA